jgi:hypothetical protein
MLLSEPASCTRQSLAKHDPGDAEHSRCLLRTQAGEVDELNRCALGLRQPRALLDQLPAGPLGIDLARELFDLITLE